METTTTAHKIATREEWQAERAVLLEREKEHTRMGDELARERRSLPWVRVEKEYTLQTGRRPEDGGGAVRRPLAAPDLPLHVRPELRGRVPGELLDRRHVRQPDPAPEGARRDADCGVRGADREAPGVPRADGVEVHLGVELSRAISTPTSASRAASSRPARRSRRFSTSCRLSPSATPRRPARTSTAT